MSPLRCAYRCALVLVSLFVAFAPGRAEVQTAAENTVAQFQQLALQVTSARMDGERDAAEALESALRLLDGVVLRTLNASGAPDLKALNLALAGYVTPQPLGGESHRAMALDSAGSAYALVANFGLSGPAAIRLYARRPPVAPETSPGAFALAGRVDLSVFGEFFDESVELAPVGKGSDAPADIIFVTVSGRTDDVNTGAFAAWRLHNGRVTALWNSELLPHSTFGVEAGGFRVAYCSDVDEDRPRDCRAMVRERYMWSDGAWKQVERTAVPVP